MNLNEITKFPNPLLRRADTVILNEGFTFSFDGKDFIPINVPFCPESKLSGIGYTDFIPVCYYRKKFDVMSSGGRVFLHFGAVDYMCSVFVNGKYVGVHLGGYTPFKFDVTQFVHSGENELYLEVRDDKLKNSPRGKQSYKQKSFGCFYTRTTGIWQSVWLEYVPENYIREIYFYPDIHDPSVTVDMSVTSRGAYEIEVLLSGKRVGYAAGEIVFRGKIKIPLSEKSLWECGKGNLYDVILKFNGDEIHSYFGLRQVRYDGMNFMLNDKPVYQKFVLDQGYNPDGVYTSPDTDFMERDVKMGMELGFNGARLHQKVFEQQFLYQCDRLGYMVWGEFPSWGIDFSQSRRVGQFIAEWGEVLRRDFNHPSIVTWCPLNEVWGAWDEPDKKGDVRFTQSVYAYTKIYDTTRPCVDVSGGFHGERTDLFDFHSYEEPEKIAEYLKKLDETDELNVPLLYGDASDVRYKKGLPVSFSECGGIALREHIGDNTNAINRGAVLCEDSWGYGRSEREGDAFTERYRALMDVIHASKKLSGFCYTQLYDVEQEVNGFYRYDRTDKLSPRQKALIKQINDRKIT